MLKLKPGLRLGAAAGTVRYDYGARAMYVTETDGTWGALQVGAKGRSLEGKGSGPAPVTTTSLAAQDRTYVSSAV